MWRYPKLELNLEVLLDIARRVRTTAQNTNFDVIIANSDPETSRVVIDMSVVTSINTKQNLENGPL